VLFERRVAVVNTQSQHRSRKNGGLTQLVLRYRNSDSFPVPSLHEMVPTGRYFMLVLVLDVARRLCLCLR
jgi:hypothetical protein